MLSQFEHESCAAMSDSKSVSTWAIVVRTMCAALLLVAGLLVARKADVSLPSYAWWGAPPKTVSEKLAIVSTELAKLPTPTPPSAPHYKTEKQILLRTRSFVMKDKRERYQAVVEGTAIPTPATPEEVKRHLHLKRMHDGIELIKSYRGTASGFSKRQIEWTHNLPVFICWYDGKHLGTPAVFFFDVDRGRWIWNYGAVTAGKADQLEYAIAGSDPAFGKIEPGLLSRSANVGLANEILTGLARVNEIGSPAVPTR